MSIIPQRSGIQFVLKASTVEILGRILQSGSGVVVKKTFLPHPPGGGIGQLGDGAVQESDGGSGLIVLGHPQYMRTNAVIVRVKQTFTRHLTWCGIGQEHVLVCSL